MTHRSWLQISIILPQRFHDLITGQLALLGLEGFQQEDHALLCFVSRSHWSRSMEQRFTGFLARFKKEFPACDCSWTRQIIREKNWNAQWERSVGIVEVTPRMIVKPSWKKLRRRDKGKIVLHIDPKMSFGTGHHETTRLSLILLEEQIRRGSRVLDMGCGTGILSIAAAKLGARAVVGIDNDPWAVANARENVGRNRVGKKIRIREGNASSLRKGSYDLIVSNIDLPANLRLLPLYKKRTARGGMIILSGLLVADLPRLLASLQSFRLAPVELIEENEWMAVILGEPDANRRH